MKTEKFTPLVKSIVYHTNSVAAVEIFSYEMFDGFLQYYFDIRFHYAQENNDSSHLYMDGLLCAHDAVNTFYELTEETKRTDEESVGSYLFSRT